MKMRFFKCGLCGNIVASVKDSGVEMMCCGEPMQEIRANTEDAALEKHVPVYEIKDGKAHVRVGSQDHPMMDDHYIEWIAVQTNTGFQLKWLKAGEDPECCFALCDGEKVDAVYAYCNMHGLWMNS